MRDTASFGPRDEDQINHDRFVVLCIVYMSGDDETRLQLDQKQSFLWPSFESRVFNTFRFDLRYCISHHNRP